MARDDMAFRISKNRIGKAERLDGRAYLIDLALGMSTRIARIGNEVAHGTVGDGQPRWESSRCYFVHDQKPAQKPSGAFAPILIQARAVELCPSAAILSVLSPDSEVTMSDVALRIACFRSSTACFAEQQETAR